MGTTKINLQQALDYIKELNDKRQAGVEMYDRAQTGIGLDIPKLKIQESVDPWDLLESVIDQHYDRERFMLAALSEARGAIKKSQKEEKYITELENRIFGDNDLNQSPLPDKTKLIKNISEIKETYDKLQKTHFKDAEEMWIRLNAHFEIFDILSGELSDKIEENKKRLGEYEMQKLMGLGFLLDETKTTLSEILNRDQFVQISNLIYETRILLKDKC